VGITPNIRESGSCVRGRSRISKVGNKNFGTSCFFGLSKRVSTIELAGHCMSVSSARESARSWCLI